MYAFTYERPGTAAEAVKLALRSMGLTSAVQLGTVSL